MGSVWEGESIRRQIRWRLCWWVPMRSELRSAYYDLRARFGGWCNHCPSDGARGGGYAFWRCQLRRKHLGLHRGINYVWTDDGATDYMPQPSGHTDQVMASPWSRKHGACGGYRRRLRNRRFQRAEMRRITRDLATKANSS